MKLSVFLCYSLYYCFVFFWGYMLDYNFVTGKDFDPKIVSRHSY